MARQRLAAILIGFAVDVPQRVHRRNSATGHVGRHFQRFPGPPQYCIDRCTGKSVRHRGWKEPKQAKSMVIGLMVKPIQPSEYSLLASLRQLSGTVRSLIGTVDYSVCIRIILAVVIVVSVASILITPDPSDDVSGVLQQKHLVKATVVPLSVLQARFPPHFPVRFAPVVSQRLVQSSLLHLVCVQLC